MGFLLKNVNSVLKVLKSKPVGKEQGKMGIHHDMSASVLLCSREALQRRILCFLCSGHSVEFRDRGAV